MNTGLHRVMNITVTSRRLEPDRSGLHTKERFAGQILVNGSVIREYSRSPQETAYAAVDYAESAAIGVLKRMFTEFGGI